MHRVTKDGTYGMASLIGLLPDSQTSEYQVWRAMIIRCTNPNCAAYKYYGGRGITVCERWMQDFSAFISDVGPRPYRGMFGGLHGSSKQQTNVELIAIQSMNLTRLEFRDSFRLMDSLSRSEWRADFMASDHLLYVDACCRAGACLLLSVGANQAGCWTWQGLFAARS